MAFHSVKTETEIPEYDIKNCYAIVVGDIPGSTYLLHLVDESQPKAHTTSAYIMTDTGKTFSNVSF